MPLNMVSLCSMFLNVCKKSEYIDIGERIAKRSEYIEMEELLPEFWSEPKDDVMREAKPCQTRKVADIWT